MPNDKDILGESVEYFDELLETLVAKPPDGFDIRNFGKHYNVVKTALAHYQMTLDQVKEASGAREGNI